MVLTHVDVLKSLAIHVEAGAAGSGWVAPCLARKDAIWGMVCGGLPAFRATYPCQPCVRPLSHGHDANITSKTRTQITTQEPTDDRRPTEHQRPERAAPERTRLHR